MGFFDVAKVLKKTRTLKLYHDAAGSQWVGDYRAMYRLYDMPGTVDAYDLFELMGVAEKDRKMYKVSEGPLPYHPDGSSVTVNEFGIPFIWCDLLYQVFNSDGKYLPVLDLYVKALKCFKGERLWALREHGGIKYVEMWHGSICIAIIAVEPVCYSDTFAKIYKAQAEFFLEEHKRADPSDEEMSLFDEKGDAEDEDDSN